MVIVDKAGFYLGDWRGVDVEPVRQVITLFSSCIRWFENNLHVQLIALFSRKKLTLADIEPFLRSLFELKVAECEPAREFSSKQRTHVEEFLKKVLRVKKGLQSTFEEFGIHLAEIGAVPFQGMEQMIASMKKGSLFDDKGNLAQDILGNGLVRVSSVQSQIISKPSSQLCRNKVLFP